jgi:hypothetical protein
MRWFPRRRSAPARPGTLRTADSADLAHLRAFAIARHGVEAYLEPRTTVTESTLLLVASDGEWTRRRIPGPSAAEELTRELGLPLYDPVAVGYPQRMREWTARRKAAEQAAEGAAEAGGHD